MSEDFPARHGLRLVLAQMDCMVGDIPYNVDRVVELAERARDELGGDAVVFPELTLTGYPPEDLLLRPSFIRAAEAGLDAVARRAGGIHLIVGHPWLAEGGLFNAASLILDGETLGRYFKQELPNYGVFDERRYFAPGTEACRVAIKGVPVGLTVCEDAWFPGPIGLAARTGAALIVNLNASPFHAGKGDEREAVIRQRVAETGLPVIYVNLVGGQDELVFDGESFVMDGEGKTMLRAPACTQGLYPVDVEVIDGRAKVAPGRIEARTSQARAIYDALVLGVRDYVRKNGFRGAVLGLSGGIDSALTLAIAVDALGAGQVEAVLMPSQYTADMSVADAVAEAQALGVAHRIIPIEGPFRAFVEVLAPVFAGLPTDVTEENIQARCRGVILMALSNKSGRILLTTGNKSELAVGYATLYGDMAGGFAPIKDCPKTLVYRLAEYRNSLSPAIPRRVIERAPSAELRPDQKDSDSLPPYPILDPILERFVEEDRSVEEIVAEGFDGTIVDRVAGMVLRNEYKRRQAPPGVRITRRAFGRDRRYPITSGYGRGAAKAR
jgi:NAD+ synthase (glutamine-hydrolysing)